MSATATYSIYRTAIRQLMKENQRLPSLPALTLKIRAALSNEHVNHSKLNALIAQDPSLSILIMREVQSPFFLTAQKATSLEEAIRLLGLENLTRLITLHGLKSLFVFQKPKLQALLDGAWKRQLFKASIVRVLAEKLNYQPVDEAVTASLVSEVGSLAILSALTEFPDTPTPSEYRQLCNEYSQSLSSLILQRWGIGEHYSAVITANSHWSRESKSIVGRPSLDDIILLAHYHSAALRNKNTSLPALKELPMYKQLPGIFKPLDQRGLLKTVTSDLQKILDNTQYMLS